MSDFRIKKHPILAIPETKLISFYWNQQELSAREGETISSALFANGIRIFGHHPKDGAPQGIYCANGQCSQCMVIADGTPLKACMELVSPGMRVEPSDGLPVLPILKGSPHTSTPSELDIPVLVIGGGPAGLSAAIELGKMGVKVILVDDKHRLGGKLVLQTHRFFGSTNTVYAGTRGIDIATRLEKNIRSQATVDIWLQSTVLAVFSDSKVGILRNNSEYVLVKPQVLLVASGAREKFLTFPGNTLPGVFGAGAFQTLVNRDLVHPAERLFIVGGGNVGLIAGYHALQAGITVAGLVEALPECGGYKVHKDKLVRMGVPIYTSHTILSANGNDKVESVTIAGVNEKFQTVPGTERTFECDSILVAVGLDPVNEFYLKAKEFGLAVFAAGDAEEIAEASAAMFSGKIKGHEIARFLGCSEKAIPFDWYRTADILKSKPGTTYPENLPEETVGVIPVIHCTQEIPCDPCTALCDHGLIDISGTDIRKIPVFLGNNFACGFCERCVAGCPGLAITIVDYSSNPDFPIVSIPYEFNRETIKDHDLVTVLDTEGNELGVHEVVNIHAIPTSDRTLVVQVQVPREIARFVAGIQVQNREFTQPMEQIVDNITNETIVCRCERVTAGEIRDLIRKGYLDFNEIKAVSRAGMGACGAKTCTALVYRLFKEEGVPIEEITEYSKRPLFVEVPLGTFAGIKKQEG
jgi:sarcosine oxidase subunit alpha